MYIINPQQLDTFWAVWSNFFHECPMTCLLNAEAEVEEAVGGVRLSIGSFHLTDERTKTVAQLSRGAAENILLQLYGASWNQDIGSQQWTKFKKILPKTHGQKDSI